MELYIYLFVIYLISLFVFFYVNTRRFTTPSSETQTPATAAGHHTLAPAASQLSSSTSTRGFIRPQSSMVTSSLPMNRHAGTDSNDHEAKKKVLACPICYDKLTWSDDPVFSVDFTPRFILECNTCKKSYIGNETHLDLTITSGSNKNGGFMPASSEMFRLPLVSFLYERGWRQGFSIWGGFPGPKQEFEMMEDYLKPVIGGSIIDASCGSGLFTRLFAKSRLFSLVVALDFSESMLKQSYDFIKQEENISQENLILVRADIARLPLASSSIDAVHAGAALHCWPTPSAGVAEISRILRPGGVFVATTYIIDGPYSYIPFLSRIRQNIRRRTGLNIYMNVS